MEPITSREVHLISRPNGVPVKENFKIVEKTFDTLGEREFLVKNHYISVDPYMRGRMKEVKSYAPPYELNQPMLGGSVGEVIASNTKKYKVGQFVLSQTAGWREYFTSNGKDGKVLLKINPEIAPIQRFLGAMGMTGLTAYIGILEYGKIEEGQTVFVSAAAGAVGSIVAQIAKLKGCKVIGSAGTEDKIKWLKELGIDEVFNYKTSDDYTSIVHKICPEGIDVYFDNVGGSMLDAALLNMKEHGRIVICGSISQSNKSEPDPVRNLVLAPSKRLIIKGFLIADHQDRAFEFFGEMGRWIRDGKIIAKETVVEGIENSVDAFLGLFSGQNTGKMLVKLF